MKGNINNSVESLDVHAVDVEVKLESWQRYVPKSGPQFFRPPSIMPHHDGRSWRSTWLPSQPG